MLYPLSYGGARAQSSDLRVHLGWQGVAHVHPRSPGPRSPSPGPHLEHTNPGLRPAVGHGGPRWHRFTGVGIRWSTRERRAVVDRLDGAKAGEGLLVVGTTPFIGEGFDALALDTLFLAGPISYDGLLVQCAGRVIRAAPSKDLAEVHDYHDPAAPILAASLPRRMPGYRALGFTRT